MQGFLKKEKIMKTKFTALLLLLSILTLSFNACSDKTVEEMIDEADEILLDSAYSIDVDVSYVCDDDVKDIFDQLGAAEIGVYVDGGKMRIENKTVINYGEGDVVFDTQYVMVDGVVYADLKYSLGGYDSLSQAKAYISEDQRDQLFRKQSVACGITADDFTDVYKSEDDVIICTGASDNGLSELEHILIYQLEGAADTVAVKNATLTIELDDGKYGTVSLNCAFDVQIMGSLYSVTMNVEMEYNYGGVSVTEPEDTLSYGLVSFDEII